MSEGADGPDLVREVTCCSAGQQLLAGPEMCIGQRQRKVRLCLVYFMPHTELGKGDWVCPKCQGLNFASREKCYTCSAHRYDGRGSDKPSGSRGSDWRCSCGEVNFAFRTACRRCGISERRGRDDDRDYWRDRERDRDGRRDRERDRDSRDRDRDRERDRERDKPAAARGRPGDWICARCDDMNFASRAVCRRCASPKESGVQVDNYRS